MKYFKFVIAIIFITNFFSGAILWGAPTESQIAEIYTIVSDGKPYTVDGTTAVFSDGTNSWTIFGAVQEKGDLYVPPATWSVAGEYDVKVVENPISDVMILPFSDPVPNVSSSTSISVKACRGEYEPASFVLRSGASKLTGVTVVASDLTLQDSPVKIDSVNVDIRVVKCWYQAGVSIDRREDNEKRLVSELLLHDNDLVRVDYENQVNLVRNISDRAKFTDSERLVVFEIPAKFNQQIWLTFRIPDNSIPGKYSGNISINFFIGDKQFEKVIPVTVEVNNYELSPPPIECALYYLAWYIFPSENYSSLGARGKSDVQMLAEFKDMREHGLTNVAIDHYYKLGVDNKPDLSGLIPVINLFREAGFSSKRFLYVDWKVTYFDNLTLYEEKINSIFNLLQQSGFNEYFVYGKDESDYDALLPYREAFSKVHELGGKNFVTCGRDTAVLMSDFLDVAILPRDTSLENLNVPNENLVVNGSMNVELGADGAGWVSTNKDFLYIDLATMKKKSGAYVYLVQKLPLEKGKNYRLEYEVSSVSNVSGFMLAAGGGSCVASDISLAAQPGKNSVVFAYNTDSPYLRFAFGSASQFDLDNVVVREEGGVTSTATVMPWAYNGPQAGKEVPGTYKDKFGVSLLDDGYEGVCNYAYQTGDCWNDWAGEIWRPHVMSYPTSSKPIPTLQWEGWREGIDAMRYRVSADNTPILTLQKPQNLKIK